MNAISLNRVLNSATFRSAGVAGIPHSESTPNSKQSAGAIGEKSAASISKRPVDTVEISAAGRAKAEASKSTKSSESGKTTDSNKASKSGKATESGKATVQSKLAEATDLSKEEKAQVAELQKIDRQTRAHEQAHLGASGGLAKGGASFSFTKGPDGQLYAVGGEVSIDTSPVPGDPDATIRKADTIRRAALAPSEPSSQDKAVAAAAAKMANQARAEKLRNKEPDLLSEPAGGADNSEIGSKFDSSNELGEILDLLA